MRPVVSALVAAALLAAMLAAAGTLWTSQRHEVVASPPAEATSTVEVYCTGTAQQVGDAIVLLPSGWYAYLKVTAVSHGPGYAIDEVATPDGSRAPAYLWVPPGRSVSSTLSSPFTLPSNLYTRAMPGDVYRIDVGLRKVDEGLVALWHGAPQGVNETSPVAFPELYMETGPIHRNETDLYIPAGVLAYWGSERVGVGRFVVAVYKPYLYAMDTDIPAFIQLVAGAVAGIYHFGNGTVVLLGPGGRYVIETGSNQTMVALDASDGAVEAYVDGEEFSLGSIGSAPVVYAGAAGAGIRPVYLAVVIDRSVSMSGAFLGIADGLISMMKELSRYHVHFALVEFTSLLLNGGQNPGKPIFGNGYLRVWYDFTTDYEGLANILRRLAFMLSGPYEIQPAAVYASLKLLHWPATGTKVVALIGDEGLQQRPDAWRGLPDVPVWVLTTRYCTSGSVGSRGACPRGDAISVAEWVRSVAHEMNVTIMAVGALTFKYIADKYLGPLTDYYLIGRRIVEMAIELAKAPLGARYEFFAVFKSRYLTIEGLWPGDRVYVAGAGRLVSFTATGPVLRIDLLRYWSIEELVDVVEDGGFRVWVVPSLQHLVALLPSKLFIHARGEGVDAWLESLVGYRVYCTPRIEMLGNATIVKLWLRDGMVAVNVSTDGGETWAFIGAAPYAVIHVEPGGRIEVAGYSITAGGPWRGVWVETVDATLAGTGEGAVDAGPVTLPVRWREALVTGPATVELRYG